MPYAEVVAAVGPRILERTIEELEEADGDDGAAETALGRFVELTTQLLQVPGVSSGSAPGSEVSPGTLLQLLEHTLKPFDSLVPSLDDRDFSAADYEKIAIAAEVEENTLANAAPLARRALRDVLA